MRDVNANLKVRFPVHFTRGEHGQQHLRSGFAPAPAAVAPGQVPKLSRLMALAFRFEGMLRRGEVKDCAELARLGHVSRARITQVTNLLYLAPDLQEAILFLPLVQEGHDPIKEWQVRPIAAQPLWSKQRRMWKQLTSRQRLGAL